MQFLLANLGAGMRYGTDSCENGPHLLTDVFLYLLAHGQFNAFEGFEAFRVFRFGVREQDRRDGIGVGFELALLFWGHLSQEVAMGTSLTADIQY